MKIIAQQEAARYKKADPKDLQKQKSWEPMTFSLAAPPQGNAKPPGYLENTFYGQVLQHFEEANAIVPLNRTENFQHVIVVDDRSRASPPDKDCIISLVWTCILLLRTYVPVPTSGFSVTTTRAGPPSTLERKRPQRSWRGFWKCQRQIRLKRRSNPPGSFKPRPRPGKRRPVGFHNCP